jgi:hypothetical protein
MTLFATQPFLRALLLSALLPLLARASWPGGVPSQAGEWSSRPGALPSSQLPHVPMTGNGQLGVMLDAHAPAGAGPPAGPGRANSLDVWISSVSFWSCGSCGSAPPAGVPGCCRAAALGGASLSFAAAGGGGLAFAATQRVGTGALESTWTTAAGGVLRTSTTVQPGAALVATSLEWAPGAGEPAALAINASLWVLAAGDDGGPAPASAGCASASGGGAAPCGAGALAAVSRNATSGARAATSARPVRAGLAAALVGAGLSGVRAAVTAGAAGGGLLEVTLSATLAAGGAPAALVLAEAETVDAGAADPAAAAAAALAAALAPGDAPARIAAAAAAWWAAFWAKSSVSLPSRPGAEAVWVGAQYILACTSATTSAIPAPGLYGVWVSSDSASWNGDYTLDYNFEAPFFGAFASNHGELAESYWQPVLDWQAAGRAQAQTEASAAGVSCPANALHYACHLAPWGFQSFDQTVYMHSNAAFAALLFINHFEYTLNETFARSTVYPLLDGINAWWACFLNKSAADGLYHDDNKRNPDAQHEGQLVPDPQISLSLLARTVSAQLTMAAALRLAPPPILADIAANLAPFNSAPYNYTPPGAENFTLFPNTRCHNDASSGCGLTLAGCEARCAALGPSACAWFTWCANASVPTCDMCGSQPSCWQYAAPVAPCTAGPGFVSGEASPSAPPQRLRAFAAFAGATVAQSDSFALYPIWPSDFALSAAAQPPPPALPALAAASVRAYVDWRSGRTVDIFSEAVLAGIAAGAGAPAFAPADVLDGLDTQVAALFGPNLLLYAPGGGIENTGVSRALCDMLVVATAAAAPQAAGAPPPVLLRLFPFWPADEPATFDGLLTKGGVVVSARYDNATRAVASPVRLTAAHTLAGAAAADVAVACPWPAAPRAAVAVACGGAPAPIAWSADGTVLSFAAPRGVPCALTLTQ